ncbi:MAG: hypothetical protein K6G16_05875 [Lachnospiraceae bacterium]|nr:hypothetical protein [Lachnospiraceae bacterium]
MATYHREINEEKNELIVRDGVERFRWAMRMDTTDANGPDIIPGKALEIETGQYLRLGDFYASNVGDRIRWFFDTNNIHKHPLVFDPFFLFDRKLDKLHEFNMSMKYSASTTAFGDIFYYGRFHGEPVRWVVVKEEEDFLYAATVESEDSRFIHCKKQVEVLNASRCFYPPHWIDPKNNTLDPNQSHEQDWFDDIFYQYCLDEKEKEYYIRDHVKKGMIFRDNVKSLYEKLPNDDDLFRSRAAFAYLADHRYHLICLKKPKPEEKAEEAAGKVPQDEGLKEELKNYISGYVCLQDFEVVIKEDEGKSYDISISHGESIYSFVLKYADNGTDIRDDLLRKTGYAIDVFADLLSISGTRLTNPYKNLQDGGRFRFGYFKGKPLIFMVPVHEKQSRLREQMNAITVDCAYYGCASTQEESSFWYTNISRLINDPRNIYDSFSLTEFSFLNRNRELFDYEKRVYVAIPDVYEHKTLPAELKDEESSYFVINSYNSGAPVKAVDAEGKVIDNGIYTTLGSIRGIRFKVQIKT